MSLQRRMARAWLAQAHASSSSPVPFLYQTHTLSTIRRRTLHLDPQPCSSNSTSDFSTSSASHYRAKKDKRSRRPGRAEEQKATPGRSSFLRRRAASVTQRQLPKQWRMETETKTKTEPESNTDIKSRTTRMTGRESEAVINLFSKYDVGERKETAVDKEPGMRGETRKHKKTRKREETRKREKALGPEKTHGRKKTNGHRHQGILESKQAQVAAEDDKDPFAEISAIFNSVVDELKQKHNMHEEKRPKAFEHHGKPGDKFQGRFEDADYQARTESYTSKVAVNNLGEMIYLPTSDEQLVERVKEGKMALAHAIELVTKREALKVDRELRIAVDNKPEAAFWKLCQDQVFSLAQFLGVEGTLQETPREAASPVNEDENKPEPEPAQPGDETQQSDTESEPPLYHPNCHLEIPACLPLDSVVIGIYPKLCRTVFILLNLHHPESHLIAQFRDKIAELGRESAFFGISTLLFNDMLYFHWRVTHNFSEVVVLCREMQTAGVRPNPATLNLLGGIMRDRRTDLDRRRDGKPSDQPWWDQPANRRAMRELSGREGLVAQLRKMLGEGMEKKQFSTRNRYEGSSWR